MAFAVRNASPAIAEMNITPLVDVMLVLLVIFMVTAPLLEQRLGLTLSQPTPPVEHPKEPLRLLVETDNAFRLGDRELSLAQLPQALEEQLALDPKTALAVRVDPEADYQAVVSAFALASQAGIESVGLENQ